MNNIIYSVKLTPSENDKIKYKKYFGIPVSLIKVLLIKGEQSELNHFERAILSLLLNKFHTNKQIADKLCLNLDLVELIINDMKNKGFLDKNCKVLTNGEEVLKGIYKNVIQENCYLIFDHNRQCFLRVSCNDNDFAYTISKEDEDYYSFKLENDAFSENIKYKLIKIEQNSILNKRDVERLLKKDIFEKNEKHNIIRVEIVEFSTKIYHIISTIDVNFYSNNDEVNNFDFKTKKWIVNNPITLEPDNELYSFFYNNSSNKDINKMLSDVMLKKMNSLDSNGRDLYDLIKNGLFSKKISIQHEEIIYPLINVIKVIDNTNLKQFSERVYHNQILANAMIHLGDLFEKVLYLGALEYGENLNDELFFLHKDDSQFNKNLLSEIAKNVGFDLNEQSSKLLFTNRKNLKRILRNPNAAELSECLVLNLVIANFDSKHYLYNLGNKYPGFINMMYEFKRVYRDKSKHSINIDDTVSLKEYIDLFFDLLEFALGYKVNYTKLNEIIGSNNSLYDYSYSEEQIRLRLGNKIIDSNKEEITSIKFSLISMFDEYITKSARYLRNAYSLIETYIKAIVHSLIKDNHPSYIKLSTKFNSKEQLKKYLISLGFIMDKEKTLGNEVVDSMEFNSIEQSIKLSFDTNFENAVLRVKVLGLVIIFLNDENIAKKFIEYGMDDFFIITSNISYLQRHKQVHEYNEQDAKIIIDGIIKMTDFIINKAGFIK